MSEGLIDRRIFSEEPGCSSISIQALSRLLAVSLSKRSNLRRVVDNIVNTMIISSIFFIKEMFRL